MDRVEMICFLADFRNLKAGKSPGCSNSEELLKLELLVLELLEFLVLLAVVAAVMASVAADDNHVGLAHCHALRVMARLHPVLLRRVMPRLRLHHVLLGRVHAGLSRIWLTGIWLTGIGLARIRLTWIRLTGIGLTRIWLHHRLTHGRMHHWLLWGVHARLLRRIHAGLHHGLLRRVHARLHSGLHHMLLLAIGVLRRVTSGSRLSGVRCGCACRMPDGLEVDLASALPFVSDLEPLVDSVANTESRKFESRFANLVVASGILIEHFDGDVVSNVFHVDVEGLVPDGRLAGTVLHSSFVLCLARRDLAVGIHLPKGLRVTR